MIRFHIFVEESRHAQLSWLTAALCRIFFTATCCIGRVSVFGCVAWNYFVRDDFRLPTFASVLKLIEENSSNGNLLRTHDVFFLCTSYHSGYVAETTMAAVSPTTAAITLPLARASEVVVTAANPASLIQRGKNGKTLVFGVHTYVRDASRADLERRHVIPTFHKVEDSALDRENRSYKANENIKDFPNFRQVNCECKSTSAAYELRWVDSACCEEHTKTHRRGHASISI